MYPLQVAGSGGRLSDPKRLTAASAGASPPSPSHMFPPSGAGAGFGTGARVRTLSSPTTPGPPAADASFATHLTVDTAQVARGPEPDLDGPDHGARAAGFGPGPGPGPDDVWQSVAADTAMVLLAVAPLQGLPGPWHVPAPAHDPMAAPPHAAATALESDLHVTFAGRRDGGGLGGLQLHVLRRSTGAYALFRVQRGPQGRAEGGHGGGAAHGTGEDDDADVVSLQLLDLDATMDPVAATAPPRLYTSLAHLQVGRGNGPRYSFRTRLRFSPLSPVCTCTRFRCR